MATRSPPSPLDRHPVVSREKWLAARTRLLAKEKAFTHARERLAAERRALPWVKVDKAYAFEGPDGRETLGDLFAGRSQLVIYHFMFGPRDRTGCAHCSFWADSFDPIIAHLNQRPTARTSTTISTSPSPTRRSGPASSSTTTAWRRPFARTARGSARSTGMPPARSFTRTRASPAASTC